MFYPAKDYLDITPAISSDVMLIFKGLCLLGDIG
jgi:hypothetical protein